MAELRRQVALENLQNQRMDNYDQDVPVEFECCFCTSKVYHMQIIKIKYHLTITYHIRSSKVIQNSKLNQFFSS